MAYTRLAVCRKATFHHIGELGVFFFLFVRAELHLIVPWRMFFLFCCYSLLIET
jgi:hypothetical protein